MIDSLKKVPARPTPQLVLILAGQLRAELRQEAGLYGPDPTSVIEPPVVNLVESLGLEYRDVSYSLHLSGEVVRQPWTLVYTASKALPPEVLVWPERDIIGIGAGDLVAVLRLSSGDLLFADAYWSAFFTFVLADDLERLVAVGETRVYGIGSDGEKKWEFSVGEIITGWRREGTTLIVTDFQNRAYHIGISAGEVHQ